METKIKCIIITFLELGMIKLSKNKMQANLKYFLANHQNLSALPNCPNIATQFVIVCASIKGVKCSAYLKDKSLKAFVEICRWMEFYRIMLKGQITK